MKKDLIQLHSFRAKFILNFYLIIIILGIYGIYKAIVDWENILRNQEYFYLFMMLVLIVTGIVLYSISYIGYYDSKKHLIILKKPFFENEKVIKLENILTIETTRLMVVTHFKHLKIKIKKPNNDIKSYYIMKGSSLFGDDEKMLREAIIKRKLGIKN
ncbi:hypothetical protein [Maribacter sp.]|uniref:hypothetical protein n=1 Tax=Maribacter sp. TaxID=1897614 RepID=UPI00329A033D